MEKEGELDKLICQKEIHIMISKLIMSGNGSIMIGNGNLKMNRMQPLIKMIELELKHLSVRMVTGFGLMKNGNLFLN